MFLDRLPSRHRYLAHFPGTGLRHQRAFLAGSSYIDELVRNSRQASEEAKEKDREIQELRERVATLEHELNENRRLRARVETLEQALSVSRRRKLSFILLGKLAHRLYSGQG